MKTTRRRFIQSSAGTGLALYGFPAIFGQQPQKFRVALVGTGWWGMNILHAAMASGTTTVVAMCDVDSNQLDPAAANVEQPSGAKPARYKDFRELLRRERRSEEHTSELQVTSRSRMPSSA